MTSFVHGIQPWLRERGGGLLNERYEHGRHLRGLNYIQESLHLAQSQSFYHYHHTVYEIMLRDVVKLGLVTAVGLGVVATAGVGLGVATLVAGAVGLYS